MEYEIINPFTDNPSPPPATRNNPMGFIPATQSGWEPSPRNGLGFAQGVGETALGGVGGFFLGRAVSDNPLVVQGMTTGLAGLSGFGGMYLHSLFETKSAEYNQRMRGHFWGAGATTLASLFALCVEGLSALGVIDNFGKERFIPVAEVEEDALLEEEKGWFDTVTDFFGSAGKKLLAPFNGLGLLGSTHYSFDLASIADETTEDTGMGGMAEDIADGVMSGHQLQETPGQVVESALNTRGISSSEYVDEELGMKGATAAEIADEELGMKGATAAEIADKELGLVGFGSLGLSDEDLPGFERATDYVDRRHYADVVEYPEDNIGGGLGGLFRGIGDITTEVKDTVLDFVDESARKVSNTANAVLNGGVGTDWYGKVEALRGLNVGQITDPHQLRAIEAELDRTLSDMGMQ